MNKKYIGKAVVLPVETAKHVEEYRELISKELGFKVSTSQAIAFAVRARVREATVRPEPTVCSYKQGEE